MKTILLKSIALLCLSIFSFTFAQKTSKYKKKTGPEFRFGLTAGAVYSFQLGYDNPEDVAGVVGITAGGYAVYSQSDKMKLQLSVFYSQYGTDFNYSSKTYQERQTYISLPFTIKAYVSQGFYFTFGPQLNINVSSTFDDGDLKEKTSPTDIGLTGGLGFNFTDNIGLDLSYYYGLNKIYEENSGIDGNIKYNAVTARLFFEF